ncbi:hypothetical protein J6590_035499 [Homalodisca vitripennis]|nr:hypothetical protein J6590_035499 [Homalodisca vitripennis]
MEVTKIASHRQDLNLRYLELRLEVRRLRPLDIGTPQREMKLIKPPQLNLCSKLYVLNSGFKNVTNVESFEQPPDSSRNIDKVINTALYQREQPPPAHKSSCIFRDIGQTVIHHRVATLAIGRLSCAHTHTHAPSACSPTGHDCPCHLAQDTGRHLVERGKEDGSGCAIPGVTGGCESLLHFYSVNRVGLRLFERWASEYKMKPMFLRGIRSSSFRRVKFYLCMEKTMAERSKASAFES